MSMSMSMSVSVSMSIMQQISAHRPWHRSRPTHRAHFGISSDHFWLALLLYCECMSNLQRPAALSINNLISSSNETNLSKGVVSRVQHKAALAPIAGRTRGPVPVNAVVRKTSIEKQAHFQSSDGNGPAFCAVLCAHKQVHSEVPALSWALLVGPGRKHRDGRVRIDAEAPAELLVRHTVHRSELDLPIHAATAWCQQTQNGGPGRLAIRVESSRVESRRVEARAIPEW